MQYLILRTFCDDKDAQVPDIYVLELNPKVVRLLNRYVEFVKGLFQTPDADHRSAYSHIASVDFEWREGYWLISGEENGGFDPEVYFQVIDADPMAIVGEEMRGARISVSHDGTIIFKGFVYDPLRVVRTCSPEVNAYIFNIAVLRKAME